jgi:hypothetical protein
MLLFSSEEHIVRWSEAQNLPGEGVMPLSKMWQLADLWYHDRLDHDWRRRTIDEAESAFLGLGLTGDFWRLR